MLRSVFQAWGWFSVQLQRLRTGSGVKGQPAKELCLGLEVVGVAAGGPVICGSCSVPAAFCILSRSCLVFYKAGGSFLLLGTSK